MTNEKEELYVIAIKNLIKKVKYLQLTIQLKDKLLSDSEYIKEIEDNEDTYVIKTSNVISEEQFCMLSDIINNFGESISTNEISGMFSVSLENSNKLIDCNN